MFTIKKESVPKLVVALMPLLCLVVLLLIVLEGSTTPTNLGRLLSEEERSEILERNSSLVDYIYLSPNADFPREEPIRKITIHHMAANLTLENLGGSFAERDRGASSNYAIDSKGRVALYVEEANRAWTSSSRENDQQAITIEVANDVIGANWHVSDEAFEKLVELCIDICQRNGIYSLDWTGDASGTLTVHRMFSATTECPGPYLLRRMPEIAARVNAALSVSNSNVHPSTIAYAY